MMRVVVIRCQAPLENDAWPEFAEPTNGVAGTSGVAGRSDQTGERRPELSLDVELDPLMTVIAVKPLAVLGFPRTRQSGDQQERHRHPPRIGITRLLHGLAGGRLLRRVHVLILAPPASNEELVGLKVIPSAHESAPRLRRVRHVGANQ